MELAKLLDVPHIVITVVLNAAALLNYPMEFA